METKTIDTLLNECEEKYIKPLDTQYGFCFSGKMCEKHDITVAKLTPLLPENMRISESKGIQEGQPRKAIYINWIQPSKTIAELKEHMNALKPA